MEKYEALVHHVRVLNHSSERMSADLSEVTERVASIEAHMSWMMRLIWIVLGGVFTILWGVFGNT